MYDELERSVPRDRKTIKDDLALLSTEGHFLRCLGARDIRAIEQKRFKPF